MKKPPLFKHVYNYLKQENVEKSLKEIYQYIYINDLFVFESATPKHVLKTTIERKTINSNVTDKNQDILFYKKDGKYGLLERLSDEEREALVATVLEGSGIDDESIEEIDEQLVDLRSRLEKLEENSESYLSFQKEYKNLHSLKQELDQVKQNFLNEETILFKKFESKENEHYTELNKIETRFHETVETLDSQVLTKMNEFLKNIETTENDLKSIKKKAEEILKFSQQAGVAKYYEQKAEKKRTESRWYIFFFVLSILVAFLISIVITLSEMEIIPQIGKGYTALTIKATLYIPILILSSFLWKLFIDAKRLFEVYDHKAILAKSISINQKVLEDENDLSKEQIIEKSTLKSLDTILESPFATKHPEEGISPIIMLLHELVKKYKVGNS